MMETCHQMVLQQNDVIDHMLNACLFGKSSRLTGLSTHLLVPVDLTIFRAKKCKYLIRR